MPVRAIALHRKTAVTQSATTLDSWHKAHTTRTVVVVCMHVTMYLVGTILYYFTHTAVLKENQAVTDVLKENRKCVTCSVKFLNCANGNGTTCTEKLHCAAARAKVDRASSHGPTTTVLCSNGRTEDECQRSRRVCMCVFVCVCVCVCVCVSSHLFGRLCMLVILAF